jgi:PPOX class probable FMN-dependent enzyme
MASQPFRDIVTSEPELRALIGTPSDIAVAKQVGSLDSHAREFIAHAPYVLIATSGSSGKCDVSPKGDEAGFVIVLDDTHLVIPDRPGNKRVDGMRNILAKPYVGLLFLVPGRDETLRVNGRAWLVGDEELLDRAAARGKRPQIAIGVEVEEVFMHCGKASLRSNLWQPNRWPDVSDLQSAACMLLAHARPEGMTLAQMEQRLSDDKNRLY